MDNYPSEPAAASEGDNTTATADAPDSTDKPDSKEHEEGETVLVAKSALGGNCKMGEVYPMKVVGIYDDEVELARDKNDDKEEAGEGDSGSSMDSKLDSVATESE